MARKIALLGTAPSGEHAPFRDLSWEIWGVSARCHYVTRADRWFEIHRLAGEPPEWAENWRKDIKRWLDTDQIPLYMIWPEDLGPTVKQYPVQDIVGRFGSFFMTSTFAWMAAMAISELCPIVDGRPTIAEPGSEIGVWGVDMEYGTEYRDQRAGIRHFLELCKQLGIQTRKLVTGGLTYEPIPYPMWQDDPLLNKLKHRYENASGEASRATENLHEIRADYNKALGAIAEIKLMTETPKLPADEDGDAKPYNFVERLEHLESLLKAKAELGDKFQTNKTACQAIMGEQEWLMDYLKP